MARASRPAKPQTTSGNELFSDRFDRKDSDKLGRHWSEVESRSKAKVESQGVVFEAYDDSYRPMIAGRFQRQALGTLVWEFDFDFRRIGPERSYSFWMQLGSGDEMDLDDPTGAGVAINLLWGGPDEGLDSHEGFGYISRGVAAQVAEVSGKERVRVEADLDAKTFTLSVAGEEVADIPFNRDVPLDTVRYFAHRLNRKNFEGRTVDEVIVVRGADGLQVAERSSDTGSEQTAEPAPTAAATAPGL